MKLLVLGLALTCAAYPQFGNATRIQSQPVKAPLACSDSFVLTWVTAHNQFECLVNPGAGGGTVTSVGFTGGLLTVATPTTTPAITVAGTSGGVPYFASASTWASSAAGTSGHLMLWGGAASAPTDGGLPAAAVPHAITFVFNGGSSTLTTGTNGLYPGNGALTGTINRVDISGGGTAGAACSITVDIWKANAAIPTSGGKISASAPVTLSSATLAQSMDISTWTKAVAANDVWGANIASVTGCITALVTVWYQ